MNICQADGIPQPEDISVQQLTAILASETPSNYKVPMSITELRSTPDKSGNDALVCDVAIHPTFFRKIEVAIPFRDFLMAIVFEALEVKYNVKINRETWIRLKNRKCIGTLIKHRIQNRDVQQVFESYQKPTKEQKTLLNEMQHKTTQEVVKKKVLIEEINPSNSGSKLIQEIKSEKSGSIADSDDTNSSKDPSPIKEADWPIGNTDKLKIRIPRKTPDTKIPHYKLFEHETNDGEKELVLEVYLPEIDTAQDFRLSIGQRRVLLEVHHGDLILNEYCPYEVNCEASNAVFDNDKQVSCVVFRELFRFIVKSIFGGDMMTMLFLIYHVSVFLFFQILTVTMPVVSQKISDVPEIYKSVPIPASVAKILKHYKK